MSCIMLNIKMHIKWLADDGDEDARLNHTPYHNDVIAADITMYFNVFFYVSSH